MARERMTAVARAPDALRGLGLPRIGHRNVPEAEPWSSRQRLVRPPGATTGLGLPGYSVVKPEAPRDGGVREEPQKLW